MRFARFISAVNVAVCFLKKDGPKKAIPQSGVNPTIM
jgi:hypothetical protein